MPNLAPKHLCTGCLSCVLSCPRNCLKTNFDENGFTYPECKNLSKCVNCGFCEDACPILHPVAINVQEVSAFAAYSLNDNLRKESSSGGVFSELALQIIQQGGIVFGAKYNNDFSVHHVGVATEAGLAQLRGAKYVQSELGDSFCKIRACLQNHQKVMFVGTPCQVAGLKIFLKKEYENLITIDFICHGVPSPLAWKEYVKYRAKKDAEGQLPKMINLRSKHTGWSDYQYSNLYEYANGFHYSARSNKDPFMKFFVGDYINRESCASCMYKGYKRVSDLTLGDFWGIWDVAPEMDDNKGTSLLLIQSEKGREYVYRCEVNLKIQPVKLEWASIQNPSLLFASSTNENRDRALSLVCSGKIEEAVSIFPKEKKRSGFSSMKAILRRIKKIL